MKSVSTMLAIGPFLLLVCSACEQKNSEDSVEIAKETNDVVLGDRGEEKDADFVVNTLASNYTEVKFAELAISRSQHQSIRDMANMLKSDHTNIIHELRGYASENGIATPTEETEKQRNEIRKLAEEPNLAKFNKKWYEIIKENHEKSIKAFESRRDKTNDGELKNWIVATLPTLKTHLDMLNKHDTHATNR